MAMELSDSEDVDVVFIDQAELSNYNPEQILPRSPETIQNIRSWLNPTSYDLPSGEFRKHLASHMPSTGAWLTSSLTYHQWLSSTTTGLLWIQGVPGSGKSVMAAHLVSSLQERNTGCPVLFFFFRQIIKSNHTPHRLLRDWLDQVLAYSPPLQAQLEAYVKASRNVENMSIQDLFKDLRLAFASLPAKVFCVADALDEMDAGNDDFLEEVGKLGTWRPEKVKVLLTSRPVAKLEGPLRVPCMRTRLEEADVDVDIAAFVHNALSTSSIPRENWGKITSAVPGRANGIFLYAKLAVDAFLEDGADIDDVLLHLPTDLNVLYTKLLREHAMRSGVSSHVQDLLLQAVTHASRPLRLIELADLMRVNLPDVPDLRATKDLIRVACGPLLEVLPDETVSVVHHSLTEYLKGMTREESADAYPVLKPGPTHACLATACLRYLHSGCLSSVKITIKDEARGFEWRCPPCLHDANPALTSLTLAHPFSKYAVQNWAAHVRASEAAGYSQDDILPDVASLLEDEGCRKAWLQVCWPTSARGAGGVTPLHIAAQVGLISYTKKLLEFTEVDVLDSQKKSAVWWAANSGHAETAGLLLAAGADPDRDEPVYGLKPLHRAASADHSAVVAKLLGAGVSPLTPKTKEDPGLWCGNAPTSRGKTPLEYAVKRGHLETVRVMLPHLGQEYLQQALTWASTSKQSAVCSLIIRQNNFDINYSTEYVGSPLNRAVRCLDVDSVRRLLAHGADPNFPPPKNKESQEYQGGAVLAPILSRCSSTERDEQPPMPCLHILAKTEVREFNEGEDEDANAEAVRDVFQMLVCHGAQLDRKDERGQTALHVAMECPFMTKLLVGAGADANLADDAGQTPIHLAKYSDVVDILIEEGCADIDAVSHDGMTAVFRRLADGHDGVTLALLRHGADLDRCHGPLHAHVHCWRISVAIIEELLRRGADPNRRNNRGQTPLLAMKELQDEVVSMLLAAGANINAADSDGATLLFNAFNQRRINNRGEQFLNRLERLIGLGANLAHRDLRGRTLLHQAVQYRVEVIKDVVALGIPIDVVDTRGNTLLHEAATKRANHSGHHAAAVINLFEHLVGMGLDVEARNHDGQTALHVLCCSALWGERTSDGMDARRMPVDFLAERMTTVNVPDNEGVTPLHIAVLVGEAYTKKLLDSGADAAARTKQGMTALHLAARARQANTVGMLLSALKEQAKQIAIASTAEGDGEEALEKKSTAWLTAHINAVPNFQISDVEKRQYTWTALHFACASGLSATVSLILDLKLDFCIDGIYRACEAFDEEDRRWTLKQDPGGHAPPMRLESTLRRCQDDKPRYLSHNKLNDSEVRLNDIVALLLAHDIFPPKHSYHPSPIDVWDNASLPYAATIIQRAIYERTPKKPGPYTTSDRIANGVLHKNIAAATEASIREMAESNKSYPMLGHGTPSADFALRFLVARQYHYIDLLQELGAEFFAVPQANPNISVFALLAKHGFADILARTGAVEAKKRFGTGDWHAWKDPSRPGLWHSAAPPSPHPADHHRDRCRRDDMSLLIHALQRHQPNMAVVKVLVETLGVNPNEVSQLRYGGAKTALHDAAEGRSWWAAHQAIPYLINRGADLDVQGQDNNTPLHVALLFASRGRPFARDTAKALILGGADVHAVTSSGRSCLALAGHDAELLKLLLDKGARITPEALLAAVEADQLAVVQLLLSRGADPNARPAVATHHASATGRPGMGQVDPSEMYALYAAAMMHSTSKTLIVRELLQHGADPFAKYLERVPEHKRQHQPDDQDDDDLRSVFMPAPERPSTVVPQNHKERTILHAIIDGYRPIDEFLALPSLDVEQRDALGMTPLLAWSARFAVGHRPESVITPFEQLVTRLGASVTATDNAGRNALHYLSCGEATTVPLLTRLAALSPKLIDARDIGGCTPLLLALQTYSSHKGEAIIDTLLSLGADPAAVTIHGNTALHILAPKCTTTTTRELFTRFLPHVPINTANGRGETALFHWAMSGGCQNYWDTRRFNGEAADEQIAVGVAFFQSQGANFCLRDKNGRSVLHRVAHGDPALFGKLIDAGVGAFWEDDAQQTALDVAAAKDNKDILRLFEKK